MSRQWMMDFDRPLSEKDKEFLRSRPGHEHLITENELRFGEDGKSGDEQDPGPSVEEQVKAMSDKDLDKHLKERGLPTSGKKKDKQERLMEYVLENEAEDDDEDDDDGDEGEGDGQQTAN